MIERVAAAVLVMAACGPRAAPERVAPVVIDAGVDAAPAADPATAELLAALAEQRDRACACADRACAEDAEALAVQWGLDHPDVVRAARPTAAEQRAAHDLIEAAEACLERWFDSP